MPIARGTFRGLPSGAWSGRGSDSGSALARVGGNAALTPASILPCPDSRSRAFPVLTCTPFILHRGSFPRRFLGPDTLRATPFFLFCFPPAAPRLLLLLRLRRGWISVIARCPTGLLYSCPVVDGFRRLNDFISYLPYTFFYILFPFRFSGLFLFLRLVVLVDPIEYTIQTSHVITALTS